MLTVQLITYSEIESITLCDSAGGFLTMIIDSSFTHLAYFGS